MMRQVIFAAALLMAGCGGKPDVACDLVQVSGSQSVHVCTEFNGLTADEIVAEQQSCPKQGGIIVDECSTDSEVGVCTLTQNAASADVHIYSQGGITAAAGESACQQNKGTWSGS